MSLEINVLITKLVCRVLITLQVTRHFLLVDFGLLDDDDELKLISTPQGSLARSATPPPLSRTSSPYIPPETFLL